MPFDFFFKIKVADNNVKNLISEKKFSSHTSFMLEVDEYIDSEEEEEDTMTSSISTNSSSSNPTSPTLKSHVEAEKVPKIEEKKKKPSSIRAKPRRNKRTLDAISFRLPSEIEEPRTQPSKHENNPIHNHLRSFVKQLVETEQLDSLWCGKFFKKYSLHTLNNIEIYKILSFNLLFVLLKVLVLKLN